MKLERIFDIDAGIGEMPDVSCRKRRTVDPDDTRDHVVVGTSWSSRRTPTRHQRRRLDRFGLRETENPSFEIKAKKVVEGARRNVETFDPETNFEDGDGRGPY